MGFSPNALKVARFRGQLNKKELAKLIGVQPRAVTGYESGEYAPADEVIEKISASTGFPISFFSREVELPENITASFRSLARMTERKKNSALASASIAYELCEWVDERMNLPVAQLPDLRGEEPTVAASILRSSWKLGSRPISNMIHLLESKGVRVFSLDETNQEVDAFSVWKGTTPFIFLNTQKSSERSRFDAAHELGHLVLHQHIECTGKSAESEADKFASAFLMPRDALLSARKPYGLEEIISLKIRWKVSAVAMLYALRHNGVLTQWDYDKLIKLASIKGWRKAEPREMRRETSALWTKVQKTLRQNGLSIFDACIDRALPHDEVSKILFRLTTVMISGKGQSSNRARNSNHLRIIK